MAESIPDSSIFKFVALRPPTPLRERSVGTRYIRDERHPRETPVGRLVAGLGPDDGANVPAIIKRYITENNFDLLYPQSGQDRFLREIEKAVLALLPDQISTGKLQSVVNDVLGRNADEFLGLEESRNQRNGIWDRYYAFFILGLFEPQNLEELTRNLRIFHLINQLVQNISIPDAAELNAILAAQPIVDKLYTTFPKPKAVEPEPSQSGEVPQGQVAPIKELWSDLVQTHQALQEVRSVKLVMEMDEQSEDVAAPDVCSGREVKNKLTRVNLRQAVEPASFRALSSDTKNALSALRVTQENFNLPETVTALNMKLDGLNNRVMAVDRAHFINLMPPAALEIRSLNNLAKSLKKVVVDAPIFKLRPNVRGSIKPIGIGDLKVVKQKLKKYAAGEVAHIENVLRGEYKERKHRILDRTEETITTALETEEETVRDTQTTDRFELKKESEKTIQEQMSVQAGVTVTGSYGAVTFGAHGDFAYSTSTQDSSKSSSNFAREVVDKSLTRIQKKTREERIRKTLHEVEEINTHGIDNKDKPDHVTGIYRWVDKYYEAQIYNYGKRLMFEFIIPEPAAFLEYAQTHQPKKALTAPKLLAEDFTPADLDDWNYLDYLRAYNVQGCTPPPPQFKMVTATMASEAKIESGIAMAKASKDLVIPEGYVLSSIGFSLSVIHAAYPTVKFSIGSDLGWWVLDNSGSNPRKDSTIATVGTYEGIVPFSINCYDINSFFINVVATCERRWEKYETWQIQTFEKIMAAYQTLQAVYEEKLAAQEVQQGIAIHGQNPRINREIEETELKKHCVKMLMDTWTFGSFDAMKQVKDEVPDFDIFDAMQEGKQVQFFEQAFEWENITYLFYPYFWGRLSQWINKVNTYDTDPLFTKFLQSGSARVLVPVRPAYNDVVMYFLEHGAIWSGGQPPKLDDPLFISLADELRNLTDDLGKATAEGEPWEVIVPTTLVYLQADATLPVFP